MPSNRSFQRYSYVNIAGTLLILGLLVSSLSVAAEWVFHIKPKVLNDVETQYGVDAKNRVLNWQTLVRRDARDASLAELQKLVHANDFFNQIRWVTDIEHWGEDDYWATPVETLASNGGDCEDFSVAKYFSLENVALPVEKLRITYVKALEYNQAHMVLAYYETPSSEPLILDNINATVLPASQRQDLLPIYSFDAKNIWLARDRGRKLKSDSMVNLPQWKGVNERLGFELKPLAQNTSSKGES